MNGTNRTAWGRRGEDSAAAWLALRGYRIVERNARAPFGEIDAVAIHAGFLCLIEIKARRSLRYGLPEEGVTPQKRRRLVRLANWYLQRNPGFQSMPVRFDVVSLLLGPDGAPVETRLIQSAFDAS